MCYRPHWPVLTPGAAQDASCIPGPAQASNSRVSMDPRGPTAHRFLSLAAASACMLLGCHHMPVLGWARSAPCPGLAAGNQGVYGPLAARGCVCQWEIRVQVVRKEVRRDH